MMPGKKKLEKQVRKNCEGPDNGSTVLAVMEESVFISSSCFSKLPQAGWLQGHLFLTAPEAGNPRSRCQCGWVLVRVLFQGADSWLLTVPSRGRERELWPLSLLIRAVILFTGLQPCNQIICQRPRLQIASLRGLGFDNMNFEGTQTFVHGKQKL